MASDQFKTIFRFFSFICRIDDRKSIENDDRKLVVIASRLELFQLKDSHENMYK